MIRLPLGAVSPCPPSCRCSTAASNASSRCSPRAPCPGAAIAEPSTKIRWPCQRQRDTPAADYGRSTYRNEHSRRGRSRRRVARPRRSRRRSGRRRTVIRIATRGEVARRVSPSSCRAVGGCSPSSRSTSTSVWSRRPPERPTSPRSGGCAVRVAPEGRRPCRPRWSTAGCPARRWSASGGSIAACPCAGWPKRPASPRRTCRRSRPGGGGRRWPSSSAWPTPRASTSTISPGADQMLRSSRL